MPCICFCFLVHLISGVLKEKDLFCLIYLLFILVGTPEGWVDVPLSTKVYIDDLNTIEKVKLSTAVSSISQAPTVILPHAIKSQSHFNRVKRRAEEMGMRVNAQKTQLLCISSNNSNKTTSYIRTEDGQEIKSTDELKILGFWFGNKPNVGLHVQKLREKISSADSVDPEEFQLYDDLALYELYYSTIFITEGRETEDGEK